MKNFLEQQIISKEEFAGYGVLPEIPKEIPLKKENVDTLETSISPNDIQRENDEQGALKKIREKIEVSKSHEENKYLEILQKELLGNPETKQLYNEIILNEDFDVLRKKTREQIKKLSELFFKSPKFFHIRYNLAQKQKLKVFTEYVDALKPIRNDKGKYDEFKSPQLTGNINSYGGLDTLVKAERYVYASFDKMAHHMSGKLGVSPNTIELSGDGLEDRAQIVMNDIANISSRASQQGKGLMEKYLTNMFDYKGGKKILSLYLALVFDDPRDVEYTFDRNDSRLAQLWDEDDNFSEFGNDHDLLKGKTSKEVTEALETIIPEKRRKFGRKMKFILQETGIEPPCSLELRIQGSVKAKNAT